MVNVIHNCAAHNCQPAQTREIRQERIRTGRFDSEILHTNCPEDILLNLAQLRSSQYLQTFRPPLPPTMAQDLLVAKAVENHEQIVAVAVFGEGANTSLTGTHASAKGKRKRGKQNGHGKTNQMWPQVLCKLSPSSSILCRLCMQVTNQKTLLRAHQGGKLHGRG